MATPRHSITYPAGGDPIWVENSVAGQITRDDFFGAQGAGAVAFATGGQAESQAGTLTASGEASAQAVGSQADTAAGTLASSGLAVAFVAGTSAQALAGGVTAQGGSAGQADQPAGGGRSRGRSRLWIPQFFPSPDESKPKAARGFAQVKGIASTAQAGAASARDRARASVTISAAIAQSAAGIPVARGASRIRIAPPVLERIPNTAGTTGAASRALAGKPTATGVGFTDAEILAAVRLYVLAA